MGGMEIFAKEAEQFCHLYASKMLALWGIQDCICLKVNEALVALLYFRK